MKIRIDIPHHPYDIQIEKGLSITKQVSGLRALATAKMVM